MRGKGTKLYTRAVTLVLKNLISNTFWVICAVQQISPALAQATCKIRFAPVNRIDRFFVMKCIRYSAVLYLLGLSLSLTALAKSPQPRLPAITLDVAGVAVEAEVADQPETRRIGMMFRTEMAENEGMLFVMDEPGPASFWMKNTLIPLSIAYINQTGMILEIYEMQANDETAIQSRFSTIFYALEMPGGWFQRQGIKPGSRISGLPPIP